MSKGIDNMYDCMNQVFDEAIEKAVEKIDGSEEYTAQPWKDFPIKWLSKRVDDEYTEWKQSGDKKELIDLINLACFTFLAIEHQQEY